MRRWRHALGLVALALAVSSPAAQPSLPSPASVIGWEPCADYKLATYEQIEQYVRTLAAAAPSRVRLVDMGRTVEGRTQVLAIVSSEANLRDIDRYKSISRRLALARDLTDDDAHALAREGKAV